MTGDDLRARLATGEPVLMPGVWDALSAKLCAAAGFDTVFVSGFAVAGALLGVPDYGYLTQTEMAAVARNVAAAAPGTMLVVDADTGYGNALNTIRTVQLWEAAGASGIFLEDQVWPKRCGHMSGKQVVDVEDWLVKLRAAVDHRRNVYVTARTDARAVYGVDAAVERAKAAADCGVDALFVEAPESQKEMEQIAGALETTGCTLVANMVETGKTPLLNPKELHELGFDLIVSPLSVLLSGVRAMRQTLEHFRAEGTLRAHLDDLVDFNTFTSIVGLGEHQALDAAYRP